ncbi:MAG: DinB family protein, partial [Planctomycetota bacterium]
TAAVKPNANVGPEVVAAFEASCDALASVIAASTNLDTQARYSHPWFGPLNASGWHALTGVHMSIHRAQIERILSGLGG